MADVTVICSKCKQEFSMLEYKETKPCPKCGQATSKLDTKVNQNFAKFLMIAFEDDLSIIQEAFEYGVERSIEEEGREIVYGWLHAIPELIEKNPQCTLERKNR